MIFKQLDDGFAVASQIDIASLPVIAAAGFRLVLNNRPDGEDAGQPSSAEIEVAAKANGLAYRAIPVTAATLGPDAVAAVTAARASADGPVLAFCRSGTRSATLWALSEASNSQTTVNDILDRARANGYDLVHLRHALETLAHPGR